MANPYQNADSSCPLSGSIAKTRTQAFDPDCLDDKVEKGSEFLLLVIERGVKHFVFGIGNDMLFPEFSLTNKLEATYYDEKNEKYCTDKVRISEDHPESHADPLDPNMQVLCKFVERNFSPENMSRYNVEITHVDNVESLGKSTTLTTENLQRIATRRSSKKIDFSIIEDVPSPLNQEPAKLPIPGEIPEDLLGVDEEEGYMMVSNSDLLDFQGSTDSADLNGASATKSAAGGCMNLRGRLAPPISVTESERDMDTMDTKFLDSNTCAQMNRTPSRNRLTLPAHSHNPSFYANAGRESATISMKIRKRRFQQAILTRC